MQDYFIECSVGGTTILKVTAESLDKALEMSAEMVADHWHDAGWLRASDVRQEVKPYLFTYDQWIEQVSGVYSLVDESERSPA